MFKDEGNLAWSTVKNQRLPMKVQLYIHKLPVDPSPYPNLPKCPPHSIPLPPPLPFPGSQSFQVISFFVTVNYRLLTAAFCDQKLKYFTPYASTSYCHLLHYNTFTYYVENKNGITMSLVTQTQ